MAEIREFQTGATRDTDKDKLDYEGFLSPLVLERYAQYMHKNRIQSDGKLRDSDNWQRGIPLVTYMKSLWRHFMDVWKLHRKTYLDNSELEDALCAVIFNACAYLHELLRGQRPQVPEGATIIFGLDPVSGGKIPEGYRKYFQSADHLSRT